MTADQIANRAIAELSALPEADQGRAAARIVAALAYRSANPLGALNRVAGSLAVVAMKLRGAR